MNFCSHFVPIGMKCDYCELNKPYSELEYQRQFVSHEKAIKETNNRIDELEKKLNEIINYVLTKCLID